MIDVSAIHAAINASHRYQREEHDNWQTPAEFDASGVGDCEDFAIAYWHALHQHARLAWCWRSDRQAHMVCLYYDDADPLVLDVAVDAVCRLSERPDLVVMYELDAQGLHSRYGSRPPTQVAPWAGVLARMAKE